MLGSPPTHVCLLEDETDCQRNSDCPITLVCGVDQRCRDECISDADCLPDQVCTQQTCALASELEDGALPEAQPDPEQPCLLDSECPFPQLCIDRVCRYECLVDADCPSLRCIDNLCTPPGPTAPVCVPGHQQSCTCPNSEQGVQLCLPDGSGYDACIGCDGPLVAGPCPPTPTQTDPSYQWDRAFTFGISSQGIRDLAVGPNGELVLVGGYTGAVDVGGQQLPAPDGYDGFILRYAANGTLQGVQTIDVGTGLAGATAVAVTPSGDIWIAGCYGGNTATTPDLGGGPIAPPPGAFLLRLDANGNHLFSQGYTFFPQAAPSSCLMHDLVVGPGGEIVISGGYYGTVNFGSGNISSPTNNDSAILLAAFDATGTSNAFARTLGTASATIGNLNLATTPAGNVFFAAVFTDTVDFGGGARTATDGLDVVVAGYGPTGAWLFDHVYDSSAANDNDFSPGVLALDGTGNVVMAGTYDATAPPDLGGGPLSSGTGTSMYETTWDGAGTWLSDVVTPNASGIGARLDGQLNRVLFGSLVQANTMGPCTLPQTSDDFVARRTAQGTIDWLRTFPNTSPSLIRTVQVGSNGELVALLRATSTTTVDFGGGPLTGDHFVVKFNPTP